MKTQLFIPRRAIAAASTCVSEDEMRFVLNGLSLKSIGAGLFLTATDGRRIIVINIAEGAKYSGAPLDLIFKAPRLLDSAYDRSASLPVEIGTREDGKPFIRFQDRDGTYVEPEIIEGKYPDYVKLFKLDELREAPCWCFNPDFMTELFEAAKIHADYPNAAVRVYNQGRSSAYVIRNGTEDFLAMLMPMRSDQEPGDEYPPFKVPEGLKAVVQAAALG